MKKLSFDIVVFGGGFCGTLVAKILEKKLKNRSIVLIDHKDSFEFTPSIHKIVFSREYYKKIIIPYKNMFTRVRLIKDSVMKISPDEIKTNKYEIKYTYLVICTGIVYPILLENKKNVHTLKYGLEAEEINRKLQTSRNILIIGGGLVGTEIAGELTTKTNKKITIVDPNDRLLSRNPVKASEYAENFLEKRGSSIMFNRKIIKNISGKSFVTDKNEKIKADLALWCGGIKADPYWLGPEFNGAVNEKHFIKVNNFLQIQSHPYVFVGGDITNIKEEKTAQNAERHAKIIAKNIINLAKNKPLSAYKPRSGPLIISLGDWYGIFSVPWKNIVITGIIPGLMKWAVQYIIIFCKKHRISFVPSI